MDYPNFYSILPASVRYDEKLTDSEKIFFSEITALSNKYGYCTASNSYFSNLYNVSKVTVSRRISRLNELKHIYVEIIREGKEIKQRRIYPKTNISTPINNSVNTPINNSVNTPINTNDKENNTSINITSINREREENQNAQPSDNYQNKIGVISPNQIQQLYEWVDDFNKNNQGIDIINYAIDKSAEEKARNFTYLNNKLRDWIKRDITTLDQIKKLYNQSQKSSNKDSAIQRRLKELKEE